MVVRLRMALRRLPVLGVVVAVRRGVSVSASKLRLTKNAVMPFTMPKTRRMA